MHAHTVERVESWDSRPFSDGVRELHDLADDDFSGAAVADGTWLFMLNGRVVGVYEGEVEDFEGASGTVYDARHPSLPLLFSMQERGGETQAKYYTNDTPLSEVDDTLTSGSFTGYVELSENVLSGDYYVVYYGGRSMSAAFVGASEELVAGDEAFERANDEVGVYEVCKTPVDVTSLPELDDSTDDTAATGAATGGAAAGGTAADSATDTDESQGRTGAISEAETASDAESASSQVSSPSTSESPESTGVDSPASADDRPTSTPTEPSGGPDESTPVRDDTATESPDASGDDTESVSGSDQRPSPTTDAASERDDSSSTATSDAQAAKDGVFDDEEEWRNARSVPTLDPKDSEGSDGGESDASGRSNSERQQSRSTGTNRPGTTQAGSKRSSTVEKLKRAVQQRNAKLEEAGERIESLEGERTDLQERVEALREERDELQARVEELESERDAAAASTGDSGSAASAGVELEPEAALADTNLFVRYDSKGKPTLDELDSETDADAVNQNLRIDHHTQFEAADASVDGEFFESFLTSSNAYRFVSWAVRELPYEIRDSGHASGLSDLYEALPRVDRAELGGTVEAELEEETVSRSFDVVLRDRMGEALVVAELNDARDAVTGDEMDALVDAANDVREGVEDLSAAMYVTASFFEPRALETASDATDAGGFLSRSDRESYVKVGRKQGYHLCLVEDRNDAFHLTVPEL
jgi:hypothetical protein